jgi:hypothetical protein
MAYRHRLAARGVVALLLVSVLAACSQLGAARDAAPGTVVPNLAEPVSAAQGPALVDSNGRPLKPEHAEVVRAVHRALAGGDLERLRELYHGDDWQQQARLLSQQRVRDEVLAALRTRPANLGEGYVYPGDSASGADGYSGYQTAFFLDYRPLENAGGALQWRGIAKLPAGSG